MSPTKNDKLEYGRDTSARPWLYASITITILLVGLLVWHLVYSYNLLTSFKNREFVIEQSSWQLRLNAETMRLSALVSSSTGDLKWMEKHQKVRAKLGPTLRQIRDLTKSPEVDRLTGEIEEHLEVITDIEKKAFALVRRGKKNEAFNLLSGWQYTKNQRKFSKKINALVEVIHEHLERKTSFGATRASILIVFGGLLILIFFWIVTLKTWRVQTREKQAVEKDLRQSENYYRAIFETSGTAMGIIEEDTTISLVNANFEKFSKYSRQEVEEKKFWTEFVHTEDLKKLKKYHYLRRQDPDNAPDQYEFRFITRHEEELNVLLAVDMIPGTSRSIASCIDITERKRAEKALQDNEKKLQAITDSALDAIIMMDSQGDIYYLNHTAESLFGYTSDEALGQNLHYLLAPKRYHEAHNANFPEFHRSGQGYAVGKTLELRALRKNGEEFPIELSLSSVKFHDGWNAVGTIREITERKRMEKKLKEMSFHDSLTGLYNRNFFEEEMRRLSDGRYNPLGIVVCDLDELKFINDTLGHEAGDQMLVNIARILRQSFRSSDIIARIGGDEFAVLISETDPEVVELMLQRLCQSVQDYNSTGPEIPLSLSMGHALGEGTTADMHALFREADNQMYREKIQYEGSARDAILQALTGSMQARDFETEGHCDRLQELVSSLARSLNLSQHSMNDLSLLIRFHDLGKVGIPDHILFKPGSLTEEEWQEMRQHCEIGHRIASSVPDLEPIADWILKHHERWNGWGYPLGVSGEDIPLPCRILAIADAYDAMTSDRPYRKAMTREEAIAELKRCAGTQFDPELVEQFIQILE